jgi:hypothetical protein
MLDAGGGEAARFEEEQGAEVSLVGCRHDQGFSNVSADLADEVEPGTGGSASSVFGQNGDDDGDGAVVSVLDGSEAYECVMFMDCVDGDAVGWFSGGQDIGDGHLI